MKKYLNLYKKFGFYEVKNNRKWNKCILKLSNGNEDILIYNNGYLRLGKDFGGRINYRLYRLNNKNKFRNLEDLNNYLLKYMIKKYI